MRHLHTLYPLGLVLLTLLCWGLVPPPRMHTIVSYNAENLFDTIDRIDREDDAFLPSGANRWTSGRYWHKIEQIAQVISRVGEESYPTMVGLVEVENAQVLADLVSVAPIREAGYRYCISNSPDRRGVNVALLYRQQAFDLLEWAEYSIHFGFDSTKCTRNVLRATGRLCDSSLLNVFVCHLPSRRGGARQSARYRDAVAGRVRSVCDSLYEAQRGEGHFIIMGDFNARASESAIREHLGASLYGADAGESIKESPCAPDSLYLYNLFAKLSPSEDAPGSYCYQRVWEQIDQIIVSRSLLMGEHHLRYIRSSARNYSPHYLRENGLSLGYPSPRRTYLGSYYQGGYSDHYPILIRLMSSKPQ